MVTTQDVLDYVGADSTDESAAMKCLDEAIALVDAFVGVNVIPDTILDLATKVVAADLFDRSKAKNGIAQFASFDGAPTTVRIARDPMAPAYPILRRAMVIL